MDSMKRQLVKDSTREVFRMHGWRHPIKFAHGYLYITRLPQYIKLALSLFTKGMKVLPKSGPVLEALRPVFAYIPERYHLKILTFEDARKIFTLDQDIAVSSDLSRKVVPFDIAHDIVIKNPDSIVAMECACRGARKDPCLPLDVCLVIGEPYCTFVMDHPENLNPRRISQEEAVSMIEAAYKKGWVHNATFRDLMGGTIYVICNCCSCCCGMADAGKGLAQLKFKKRIMVQAGAGYLAVVDEEKCKPIPGCECVERCPFEAVFREDGHAVVDPELCTGCGVCRPMCPEGAFVLKEDPSKGGLPLNLDNISP